MIRPSLQGGEEAMKDPREDWKVWEIILMESKLKWDGGDKREERSGDKEGQREGVSKGGRGGVEGQSWRQCVS